MAAQVAIIHGWSDTSKSFHDLRDFLVANGYDVSIKEAKALLERAFRDYALDVFSDRFEKFLEPVFANMFPITVA